MNCILSAFACNIHVSAKDIKGIIVKVDFYQLIG